MSDVSSFDAMVDHLLLSLGEPSRDTCGRDAEFFSNVDSKSTNMERPNADEYRRAEVLIIPISNFQEIHGFSFAF